MKIECFIPQHFRQNLNNQPNYSLANIHSLQGTTLKQQKSQTVQNYIEFLSDFYETFTPRPNIQSVFYPRQLKKNLEKRKNQNSERIVHGIKAPSKPANARKALQQMKLLNKLQASQIQMSF